VLGWGKVPDHSTLHRAFQKLQEEQIQKLFFPSLEVLQTLRYLILRFNRIKGRFCIFLLFNKKQDGKEETDKVDISCGYKDARVF
jgi:hypothetical protein